MSQIDETKRRALEDAITAVVGSPMVTRYVVVAETIEADGEPGIVSIPSPGLPLWAQQGMLRWEADTMGGQPFWTVGEDGDE